MIYGWEEWWMEKVPDGYRIGKAGRRIGLYGSLEGALFGLRNAILDKHENPVEGAVKAAKALIYFDQRLGEGERHE